MTPERRQDLFENYHAPVRHSMGQQHWMITWRHKTDQATVYREHYDTDAAMLEAMDAWNAYALPRSLERLSWTMTDLGRPQLTP